MVEGAAGHGAGPMPIDRLQAMLDAVALHRALGLRFTAVTDDRIQLEARPSADHSVGPGQLHGGVVATVLDTAATFALIAATGSDWGTVDLRVDYLRPAPVACVEASAGVLRAGRSLGRAEAELVDPATGRIVASAVGTFVRQAERA